MGHNFTIEEQLEQEWIAGGAHESFVSWLCSNLAETRRQRDTFHKVLDDIAATTGRNGHTASNIVLYARDTLKGFEKP